MTSNLIRRAIGELDRMPRTVERRIEAAHHVGLVAAADMNAAAYATHVGMMATGLLSMEEEQLIKQAPLGADRYKLLADGYAAFASIRIARMGMEL